MTYRATLKLVILASILATGCVTNNNNSFIAKVSSSWLCRNTLLHSGGKFVWDSNKKQFVTEAKNRGLTPMKCASLLGKSAINYVPSKTICNTAITKDGRNFTWVNSSANGYIAEAKRRGLTPEDCARISGRWTTQVANKSTPTTIHDSAKIQNIQKLLKELGYNPGTVNGVLGSNTQAAIVAFQSSLKGYAGNNGEINNQLMAALNVEV